MVSCHLWWAWRHLEEATVETEASCHFCQACSCLAEGKFQVKASHLLCQLIDCLVGVTKQVEIGCHLRWTWGHLAKSIDHAEVRHCLFGVCGPLRDFRKVHSVEKLLEMAQAEWENWVEQGLRESPGQCQQC